jgi:hypothetical protein
LSFSNARTTDAGDYSVVVANALGTVTSNKATLTVSAVATPNQTPSGSSGSGSGGGGSIEGWFVLALLALGATARFVPSRKFSLVLQPCRRFVRTDSNR